MGARTGHDGTGRHREGGLGPDREQRCGRLGPPPGGGRPGRGGPAHHRDPAAADPGRARPPPAAQQPPQAEPPPQQQQAPQAQQAQPQAPAPQQQFAPPPQTFGGQPQPPYQQQQFPPQQGFAPPPAGGPSFGGNQSFGGQPFGGPPQQFTPPPPAGGPSYGGPSYGGNQTFGGQPQPQPQPQFGGYQEPQFDYQDDPRRRRTPLLIGAAAVLVLVIGGAVVWAVQNSGSTDAPAAKDANPTAVQPGSNSVGSGGGSQDGSPAASAAPSRSASPSASASGSPSAGPQAQAQAQALDALLSEGENAKAPIGNAVAKVRSCPAKAEVDSAAKVFDTGAAQRDSLLAELAALKTDSLPGGDAAVAALKTAWQTSADIDRAYAAWARTVSDKGCTNNQVPSTADLGRANDLNPKATQAKQDFAAKWKPIAQAYGLTPRTGDRI
ncbi:hypothetical protein OU787_08840 [Kitasatospora sp. YST-16]|uniref:hypothetical protein n=1 Tax=Kitasatospora sp. YST-16 TaxID=2998080 RepID=UPI0022851072|nr:hypothetical protein [Kitasatospora sp. YST-16]WAL71602.1 hypothetical protein OU787_08840 [Kitasatospora sp. YST-16]WNW37641.1 hypothetical protein RKE32_08790 [Streptomyces sp. Li-HN-5-13]